MLKVGVVEEEDVLWVDMEVGVGVWVGGGVVGVAIGFGRGGVPVWVEALVMVLGEGSSAGLVGWVWVWVWLLKEAVGLSFLPSPIFELSPSCAHVLPWHVALRCKPLDIDAASLGWQFWK